ncbi:SOS response-associated peptidase family protein [Pseudomonas atacamensis]|uniref:SOS response-associated peptidase family protein n=1 Tax=Pseudomonas atacamensis TaxID=2565368 RepID=UPI0028B3D9EA|nr:SOS response-associated peptidase family protein [Pseudomonas atacamensis]MDT6918341.1 SOS response-associated peptidase family protein [Pseudomonas atacamensis]
MCEYMVQHATTHRMISLLAAGETTRSDAVISSLTDDVLGDRRSERQELIKPGMSVNAICLRDGSLDCVHVRWGWTPIWSMGTMPPMTCLPLHLVMRSRVFDRVKRDGRVLVAVEGWYDSLDTGMALHSRNLDYTTLRQPSPIFLAALAQVSKSFNGCDGMTLVTHEAAQKKRQRLLAFTAEDAMGWLRPDLEWPEASLLARHNAVGEDQLEHVLASPPALPCR